MCDVYYKATNNASNLLCISNFSPYSTYATVKSKSKKSWKYDVAINFTENIVDKEHFHARCSCKDSYGIKGKQKNKICWHVVLSLLHCIECEGNINHTNISHNDGNTNDINIIKNNNNSQVSTDLQYDVERVIALRKFDDTNKYLIKWLGYPMEEATWEEESNLDNANQCVAYYKALIHNSRVNVVKRTEAN